MIIHFFAQLIFSGANPVLIEESIGKQNYSMVTFAFAGAYFAFTMFLSTFFKNAVIASTLGSLILFAPMVANVEFVHSKLAW